jgi:AbrB family looped-hinge helix DNA binding protein
MIHGGTVTSKMQLTIPINIARKVGITSGEKVTFEEENGRIVITPVKQVLTELAGSLSMPAKWKSKDIDAIIHDAKAQHFQKKNV